MVGDDTIRVDDVTLSAEALLGRPCWRLPWTAGEVRDRCGRVLVTGAGGSVGRVLTEALDRLETPLVLCDADERGLDRLSRRFPPSARRRYVLADIADPRQTAAAFQEPVGTVLHLAAKKHVKYAEDAPLAAALTNVLGTLTILEAATEQAAPPQVVVASSDKAALAHNVLGQTKRVAERLTATFARDTGIRARAVRFCNILGTAGNVLEHFLHLARQGERLPVWSADMTRYFCSSGEAVGLLLWGVLDDDAPPLYSLDVGAATPIVALAERFLAALEAATGIAGGYTVTEDFAPMHVRHELLWREGELAPGTGTAPGPIGLHAAPLADTGLGTAIRDSLTAARDHRAAATLLREWAAT